MKIVFLLFLVMLQKTSFAFVVFTTKRSFRSSSSCSHNSRYSRSCSHLSSIPFRAEGWRPTVQDVDRISWGKPAKQKRTGSRGVPHRLNVEERVLYDLARQQRGFLELSGSGWRSQRRDAPLYNTYRSLCDAQRQCMIVLHKQSTGMDEIVVDLSPLRLPEVFQGLAETCVATFAGTCSGGSTIMAFQEPYTTSRLEEEDHDTVLPMPEKDDDPWATRPIYQLPPYCIVWDQLPRSEAKALAKNLANHFEIRKTTASSQKPVGVKPGKNRRHGGYGIG